MSVVNPDKHSLSSRSPSAGDLPSIREAMMAGGYFLGTPIPHFNEENNNRKESSRDVVAQESNMTRLPPISTATTATAPSTAAPMALSQLRKNPFITPLSSLSGVTSTPSSSAESTRNTPTAARGSVMKTEGAAASSTTSPCVARHHAKVANETNINGIATAARVAVATASSNRPSLQKGPFSQPKLPTPTSTRTTAVTTPTTTDAAPAESSIHSTPPPCRPASENRDANISVSVDDRANTHPFAHLKKPGTLDSIPPSATRRITAGVAAATLPPPLSSTNASFAPMRRITTKPKTSTSSISAGLAGASADGKSSPVVSRLTPRNPLKNPPQLSASVSIHHSNMSTSSVTAHPQIIFSRHSSATAELEAGTAANTTTLTAAPYVHNSYLPPPPDEVPVAAAATGLDDSATEARSIELAQHRTFSHTVTSADDWLNPCSRPKSLAVNAGFYASTQPAATAAGIPPGVTASQYSQHLLEVMASGTDDNVSCGAVSSQTFLTDANTGAACGTPNTRSTSDSDMATSASNDTAPFTGSCWRPEDGAAVHRQYPPHNPSFPSADSVGFIPISREQRTMSPQSQRWESSGGLSLYSSVVESTLAEQQQQQQNNNKKMLQHPNCAPIGLSRRSESNSITSPGGSGDIMAPVRLSRNNGGASAAILSSSTATMTTVETTELAGIKQEPLVMPPVSRNFSLQHHLPSSDDLLHNMRFAAAPQSDALSSKSAPGSASVLSMNEGPSSMRLPLARFMRNASTGPSVNEAHMRSHRALQLQQQQMWNHTNNNPNSSTPYPQRSNSPPTVQQQQQQGLAYAQRQPLDARPTDPAVLSLRSESPHTEGLHGGEETKHINGNNNSNTPQATPSSGLQSPHQSLHQGQMQVLDGNVDFTASFTLTLIDAISNVSRAASGISLAAETTFVGLD